jgi:hypothetical protein
VTTAIKTGIQFTFGVLAIATISYIGYHNKQQHIAQSEIRMTTICPSFLSIARSARDTLIVMRNEPLCSRYVLETLQ